MEEVKVKPVFADDDSFKRFENLLKKTENFTSSLSLVDVAEYKEAVRKLKKSGKALKSANMNQPQPQKVKEELPEEPVKEENAATFHESPGFIKNGVMRDYQVLGLNWLIGLYKKGLNGILADEMGLGKTIQAIALIGYMKHVEKMKGKYLIVVPKSTLANWAAELKMWCPSIDFCTIIGDQEARKEVMKNVIRPGNFEVCCTTYEWAINLKNNLNKHDWDYLIVDEGHRIKNSKCVLGNVLRGFRSRNRLLLTGTPLQNNMKELWSLLNFLLPDIFSSCDDFGSWFSNENLAGSEEIVSRLHKVLNLFMLRRIKADVEATILPKKEVKIFVNLSPMQRDWYTKVLMKNLEILDGAEKVRKIRLMNLLMQLRKVANHPYQFDGAEPGPPYKMGQHIVDNSGKMVVLDKLLIKLKAQGSRVLIFSQFVRVLDILDDYLRWKKYAFCRLDGQTAHEDRQASIDEFNSPKSKKFIFLLSTRAGGLGINLASADVVIMFDSDFNPQWDVQAIDRAHRIGQKKQVRVFRLIVEDTVDEYIMRHAEIKLRLDSVVIQQGRLAAIHRNLNRTEMADMIRDGYQRAVACKFADGNSDDIDTILSKCEVKTAELNAEIDEKVQKSETDNFSIENIENFKVFGGKDYRGVVKDRENAAAPVLGKRKRTTNYLPYFYTQPSKTKAPVDVATNPTGATDSEHSDDELIVE